MADQKPIVGKNLLRSLMLQLYSNPRCIYREYIQNGLDAINEAVKLGVLKQNKDGLVSIKIGKHDIVIEDNGTGIKEAEAPKKLMDIANSSKNGVDTAGRFGIGKLSGGGYCDTLIFTTSYVGESVSTTVSMDIRKLRTIIDNSEEVSAEEVMTEICSVSKEICNSEDHFFKVCLHNIVNSAEILLNEEDILSYIRQTAPIGYSTVFNTLIDRSSQQEFALRHKQIEKIRVSLNNQSDVEKSYGLRIKGSDDEILKLRYFELPADPKFGRLAWGWYAVTRFTKQIDETNDENVGIRLRIHNISLDKDILNTLFKEPRGNKYFYGEIFITNDKIEPDSSRQGLAAGEEADALRSQLRKYFKDVLYQLYTRANKYKGQIKNIREYVDKIGKSEQTVRPILAGQLQLAVEKFQKATEATASVEINDVIDIFKKTYNKELSQKVTDILINYGNHKLTAPTPQPSPSQVPQNKPTSTSAPKPTPTSTPEPTPASTPEPAPALTPEPTPASTPTPPATPPSQKPSKKTADVFANLSMAGYTDKEVALLRKAYKYMGFVCTSSEKKKLAKYMEWAVKNIVNEETV